VDLIHGLLTVEQTDRLSVKAVLGHRWLEGAERLRWGDEERKIISAVVRGAAKPLAVMRSVARMYGEELPIELPPTTPEASPLPSVAVADSVPLQSDEQVCGLNEASTSNRDADEQGDPLLTMGSLAMRRVFTGDAEVAKAVVSRSTSSLGVPGTSTDWASAPRRTRSMSSIEPSTKSSKDDCTVS